MVISPFFDWADDRHPRTPYRETVIYEAHVRGLVEDRQPPIEHVEIVGWLAIAVGARRFAPSKS